MPMKTSIDQTAWINHTKGNNQFLKPTPRTCQAAFGSSWEANKLTSKDKLDILVFVVVVIFGGAVMLVLELLGAAK